MNSDHIRTRIASEFGLPSDMSPDAWLGDHLDSLRLIELIAFIEEEAGLMKGDAPGEYPIIQTMGDACDYYEELTGGGVHHPQAEPGDSDDPSGRALPQ